MTAPSQAIQKSLQRLRGRMIRTARGFRDYNFRQYFVQHIKDDFDAVAKLSSEEQKKYLAAEGREKLRQMQRMVVVNQMYAKCPVYFDNAVDHHPHKRHTSTKEKKIE
ncbi:putative iron-sulfur cluster assembly protein [Leptomonas seymouri]|uniref:Putative iron-sulfur cluster assembly protein n=1 Tax=Leptomonas seymouri TaxID=5684 RepID=A0A0N1PCG9_LEPSE|nr:putative iron-sulfur cluster assembly protein [Leptomonas seymouri]|eukprot:KPI85448.1 putative iron-sulfur cluster assembly protein [Leptomonas seymouri]